MAKKQNKFNPFLTFVLCVVFAVFGVVAGGYGYFIYKTNEEISKIHVYSSGEITFHFLELGNVKTGDCTYIKAGEIDILIAPINGAYGNLNERECAILSNAIQPKLTIPCHFGMFAAHGGSPNEFIQIMNSEYPEQQYLLMTPGEGIEIF